MRVSIAQDETAKRRRGEIDAPEMATRTFLLSVMPTMKHFRDLTAYQGAMDLIVRVSELAKKLASEERFALADQIGRFSRSIWANLAEEWRKRRYQAAFVSKLNDAEAEAAETQVHLEIALRHSYIAPTRFEELDDAYDKVLAQIVKMIDQPERWVLRLRKNSSCK